MIASSNPSGDVRARRRFAAVFGGTGSILVGLYARPRSRPPRKDVASSVPSAPREAFALVAVLAVGGALAALALAAFSLTARDTARAQRSARARQLAVVAADEALRRLRELAEDDPSVDHLAESWARPFAQRRPDGTRVESRVEDEDRRLDLNRVKDGESVAQAAARLFLRCGLSDPWGRVMRLRSALSPPDGAKRSETRTIAPLRVWADLTEIPGFEREVMERQQPRFVSPVEVFTVLPPQNSPGPLLNVNTAPPEVLFAWFGPEHSRTAYRILAARETAPIRSHESLAGLLANVSPDVAEEWLQVRSAWFRVEAVATDGRMERRVRVLARREPTGLRIVEWTSP
ncbi:general secretion pathway protein GspK [Thermosphaera sp.]